MKYKLLVSDEAYWDIADAVDYYRHILADNLENRFREELKQGLNYITENPEHLAVKYKEIRIYNLKKFPYQIHFLLNQNSILVFGVFRGKSNPKSWEERLNK